MKCVCKLNIGIRHLLWQSMVKFLQIANFSGNNDVFEQCQLKTIKSLSKLV